MFFTGEPVTQLTLLIDHRISTLVRLSGIDDRGAPVPANERQTGSFLASSSPMTLYSWHVIGLLPNGQAAKNTRMLP